MIAFYGLDAVKEHVLARVRAHRAADEIIHGRYWYGGKGCAVGCTVHSANHAAYETELGIPLILARLEDGIFEGLPAPNDLVWPERFLAAIHVGADLHMIWPQFALRLLSDRLYGVVRHAQEPKQRQAVESVVTYYRQWSKTTIQPSVTVAVGYAATDADGYAAAAAGYAADAAAHSVSNTAAAGVAAGYAVDAAACAAAAAAYSVSNAAAVGTVAKNACWIWQGKTLLSLLSNTHRRHHDTR